ncbi:MAG: hypothetical protein ACKO0M_17835 [Cyanobium sp.]
MTGLALGLPLVVSAREASGCLELRNRRDGIAAEAMQAEIALVHALRLRFCPRQEALADQAHAPAGAVPRPPAHGGPPGAAEGEALDLPAATEVDYGAYIQCRHQAERVLQRSRVVLYRNQQGFPYYTVAGARLGRQADLLQIRIAAVCGRPAIGSAP